MLPPPVAGRALPPEAVLLMLLPTITATAMTIVARVTKSLKGGVLALRCAFAMQPLVHDRLQAEVVHVDGSGGNGVAELFEQLCEAASGQWPAFICRQWPAFICIRLYFCTCRQRPAHW